MTNPPPEIEVAVRSRATLASDVDVFELVPVDGAVLPEWRPGAHIDVLTDIGAERQYSLCGDPADRTAWRVGVLREPAGRGGSLWIHQHLTPGARVRVRGPWNHFTLAPAAGYRFIAGGIGITPLLPMLAAAEAAGTPWTLDYSARSRDHMGFLEELAGYGDRVRLHPSDEGDRLDIGAVLPAAGELVFACGPRRMVDALEEAALAWPAETLHVERFEARELTEPVLHESFEVELVISGTTVEVAEDQSVLDAVEAAGVFVLSSCREGTCGTCETVVLEGEVDHRDSILSPGEQAAGDRMMICVSRAACPRLVLEL